MCFGPLALSVLTTLEKQLMSFLSLSLFGGWGRWELDIWFPITYYHNITTQRYNTLTFFLTARELLGSL